MIMNESWSKYFHPTGQFYFEKSSFDEAEIVIIGLPWDSTTSNKPGARFGPPLIRREFNGIESFSPYFNKDIGYMNIFDAGDMELPFGNTKKTCFLIENAVDELLSKGNKKIVTLGGEHLLSYPVIKSCLKKIDDLHVLHLDAHADLREEYLGEKMSHATVMNLVGDLLEPDKLIHFFIRSGTRDEWERLGNSQNLLFPSCELELHFDFSKLKGKNVYLTLDLDVFDPSLFPGTGTPEPGGIFFHHFIKFLSALSECNIVGADIMELSPPFDPGGISSALACKVLREIMCSL